MIESDHKRLAKYSCRSEQRESSRGEILHEVYPACGRRAQNYAFARLYRRMYKRCVFRFRLAGCLVGLIACVTLFAAEVWAGGAFLYELGTPDLGMAAAGR